MKGVLFAFLGGMFITLQGVLNANISGEIGTLPAITITQFTGFFLAFTIWLLVRDGNYTQIKSVKTAYLFAGSFGLLIIFNEVTAIHSIGITLTMSMLLISQVLMAFFIDTRGWFGMEKKQIHAPQYIGVTLMVLGVIVMQL
ncbi:DMT family transporter [Alteribacter aurantiacus]|uniref:DMT family transporter n=1 Tax=Alteribacter aurantiacus TaxID=254410 RepID=UPI000403A465|nr:DMT family transporter [Alteribacter aurantiacus]